MEPIEKAVFKAMQAKQKAFNPKPAEIPAELPTVKPVAVPAAMVSETPVTEAPAPTENKHAVFEQPLQRPAEPQNSQTSGEADESAEQLRRLNARKQLFPAAPLAAKPSPPNQQMDGQTSEKPPRQLDDPKPARIPASTSPSSTSPATAGPGGSLSVLDPKALDALVNKRLEEASAQGAVTPAPVSDDSSSDALHLLRLLDREFGVWENALRKGDMQSAIASRNRSLELQSQIPAAMARPLDRTIEMLSRETDVADGEESLTGEQLSDETSSGESGSRASNDKKKDSSAARRRRRRR